MDIDVFATQIVGIHALLVAVTKEEVLAISPDEGKKLAIAVKNITALYSLTPSPEIMAWTQLITVLAAIYVPRIFIINLKLKASREANQTVLQTINTAVNEAASPTKQQGVYRFQ